MTRPAVFALAVTLTLAPAARADERVLFLREQGAVAAAPPGAITPTPTARDAPPPTAAARAALTRARELYLASLFREASGALHGVAGGGLDALVHDDRALALELLRWAGACALLAGDREAATVDFRRALALAPDQGLPAGAFPPEVDAHFDDVRRALALAGATAFTVRTTPPGARIAVDGRDEGLTPVTVRLAQGLHTLRVERTGYRPWLGPLRVDGAPEQVVVLTEAHGAELRAQAAAPEGLATAPDAATLARLRAEFGAARVVVALRDGGELVHPARSASPLPWIVAGAAALAVGAGVGLYFLLRPEREVVLVSP